MVVSLKMKSSTRGTTGDINDVGCGCVGDVIVIAWLKVFGLPRMSTKTIAANMQIDVLMRLIFPSSGASVNKNNQITQPVARLAMGFEVNTRQVLATRERRGFTPS